MTSKGFPNSQIPPLLVPAQELQELDSITSFKRTPNGTKNNDTGQDYFPYNPHNGSSPLNDSSLESAVE